MRAAYLVATAALAWAATAPAQERIPGQAEPPAPAAPVAAGDSQPQATSATTEQTDAALAAEGTGATAQAETQGDIVVTAQKRSQRLQDVPLTVQAFGAATIEQRGVTSLDRLTSIAPGVQLQKISNTRPQLYIRGIGTRQATIGSDQSIGVFIDDFYLGDASAVFSHLSDIERIEVLKGPQGTLYGRNTIGGAINIVTKEPTKDLHGQAQLSLGNYDLVSGEGSISGAIAGENLLGRVSFYSEKREGYMLNTATGNRAVGIDQSGIRGEIVARPTSDLKLKLTADYNRDTSPGQFGKNRGPGVLLRNTTVPLPAIDPDPFHQAATLDPTTNLKNYGANLRADWDVGAVTLSSLSQYRKLKFRTLQTPSNAALDVLRRTEDQNSHNVSQEIRAASNPGSAATFDGLLDWIVGGFYFHQTAHANDIYDFGTQSFPRQLASGAPVFNYLNLNVTTRSYAAYADVTAHLTPRLSLILGLRYSRDEKDGSTGATTSRPGVPLVSSPFQVPLRLRSSSWDPKVSLSWKATDAVLVYANYSQGFKSGGFQYLATSAAVGSRVFGPEGVDYYEAGVKTQWLDRRLTLNAAGFHGKYKGLQLQRLIGATLLVDNAASVKLRGIETEAHATVSDRLSLDASYILLDNTFDDYNQCVSTTSVNCADLGGTRLTRSPRHQLNLGGQYVLPIRSGSDLTLRADWVYRSKYLLEPGGLGGLVVATGQRVPTLNPLFVEPSNDVLDLRLTYRRDAWSLSAWATNLTDTTYRGTISSYAATPTPLGDVGNTVVEYYAPPRMYGVTLGFRM